MNSTTTSLSLLAQLRISVLTAGESLPDLYWDSAGLSEVAQQDLKMVFPRTSILAAVSHASALARAHHDKLTRASGVYHLFRLPTELESRLHQTMLRDLSADYNPRQALWKEMEELPTYDCEPEAGAINLKVLNPTSFDGLGVIAHTYKRAIDAQLACVPFFTMA